MLPVSIIRRRLRRSGRWTPAQLTTALWLDAADTSTITLNGSTVSQWNDLSGNSRHATQASAANQPIFTAAGLNGLSVINFSTNDTMATGGFNIGTTSSVFALIRPNSLGVSNRDYVTTGAASNLSAHILYHDFTLTRSLALYSGSVISASNVLTANAWSICAGITNGANSELRHNGATVITGNAGASNWTDGVRLGRSAAAPNQYADAAYAEVIIIATAIPLIVRQQIEGYLAWKWGLQASLPIDHPYYSAPPLV